MELEFLILVTGYNCADKVEACAKSVIYQDYKNWKAFFISDGSTDGTNGAVAAMTKLDERITSVSTNMNMGAAYQRHVAVFFSGASPESVIVLLGMDDELLPGALSEIKKQYDNGKWVTYGNWINQHGKGLPEGFELDFPEEIHRTRDYRKVKYRSTAPNTFKKFLFDQIPASEYKVNGEWIKATTESHVMFSCLEMAGKDRIGIITKPIYLYNQSRPDNARKRFGDAYQDGIYREIINRPKKDLYEKDTMTQVKKKVWEGKMKNLQERRKTQAPATPPAPGSLGDYASHLSKVFVGRSVLDVGCGSQALKSALPEGVEYTGMDAFPCVPDTLEGQIERANLPENSHETVCCFATLDGCQDIEAAVKQMKRIARRNVVFLTGIDIEPNEFHTHKITEEFLKKSFADWKPGTWVYLAPQVLLCEFIK